MAQRPRTPGFASDDFLERLSRAEASDSQRQHQEGLDKQHFHFASTKVLAPPGGASSMGGIFGTEDAHEARARREQEQHQMQQQAIMELAARLRGLQQEMGLPMDDDVGMDDFEDGQGVPESAEGFGLDATGGGGGDVVSG